MVVRGRRLSASERDDRRGFLPCMESRRRKSGRSPPERIAHILEDVKAGRTKPVREFLDEFERKRGIPR